MKKYRKLVTALFIWIGLPISMYSSLREFGRWEANSRDIDLFIMYLGFSWSIAMLVFMLDITRQYLLRPHLIHRSAIRLGAYALIAALLASIVRPQMGDYPLSAHITIAVFSFIYGISTGFAFIRLHYPSKKAINS